MPLTTQQQQVLTALHHANGPLSAYALLDRLRGSGFSAPTQVYRVLEKLRDDGLIHRLAMLNAWVACSREPGHCAHNARAFAICDQCGRVDEFSAPELTQCLVPCPMGEQPRLPDRSGHDRAVWPMRPVHWSKA